MTEIKEKDKEKILEKLYDSGRVGWKTSSLTKQMDLDVDSRELARFFGEWPEVRPRDSEIRPPWHWILKRNVGTPTQF